MCTVSTNGGARGVRSSVFQSGARHSPSCQGVKRLLASGSQLVSLHWNFFTATGHQQVHFILVPRWTKQDPSWGCLLRGRGGGGNRIAKTDPWQRESLLSRCCIRTQIQRIYLLSSLVFGLFWTVLNGSDWVRCLKFGFVWFYFRVGHRVCGVCCGTLDFAWFCYNESLVW